MREIRLKLRELKETGQSLPDHEFRERVDEIIRMVDEIEDGEEQLIDPEIPSITFPPMNLLQDGEKGEAFDAVQGTSSAALAPGNAGVCCKGLAPVSECRCEQERAAQGHPPYQRSGNAGAVEADKVNRHPLCNRCKGKGLVPCPACNPIPAALDPVTVEAMDARKVSEGIIDAVFNTTHSLPKNINIKGDRRELAIEILADTIRRALSHPAPGNAGEADELIVRLEAMERGEDVHVPLAKVIGTLKRLRAAPASNPQEGGAVSRRASEGDPK